MADRPSVRTKRLSRDKLATFLKSHELIKAFEHIAVDVGETLPDAIADFAQDSGSVLAARSFTRPIPQLPPEDAASQILAAQIFGT